MDNPLPYSFKRLILGVLLVLYSCASVPKEVVQLSNTIGQDLGKVHFSYTQLIRVHFDGKRKDTEEF